MADRYGRYLLAGLNPTCPNMPAQYGGKLGHVIRAQSNASTATQLGCSDRLLKQSFWFNIQLAIKAIFSR